MNHHVRSGVADGDGIPQEQGVSLCTWGEGE